MTKFRPPQQVLDVFWTLSDGNDDQRSTGAVKLAHLIQTFEENERKEILQYCQERLIRGLSSGRKFARVGFSVALVQLLRENEEMDTSKILSTIKDKLKNVGPEKKSQSEIGGIYLGKAFAVSSLIQAGRVAQLSGDVLSSLVDELFKIEDKKSYLKAVCEAVLRDLVQQVSADVFATHLWPKMKVQMKKGWEACTLDRLALLLACRARFPEVVKKKFLRKHWGFPVLSEDNDSHLLAAVLESVQRSEVLMDQILPQLLGSGRNIASIWKALGEKLMEQLSEKKLKTMAQRQLMGLKLAFRLVASTDDGQQVLEMLLSPGLARCVFHTVTKRNDPVSAAADSLCQQVCKTLADGQVSVLSVLERVWKLEAALLQQEHSTRIDLVKSTNFLHLVDLLSKVEADSYSQILMGIIMEKDKWQVISDNPVKKMKQIETCLRQLQHISSSQAQSSVETQRSVLALFLRLTYFHVTKATKKINHCESCVNLQEDSAARKLSAAFIHKVLDSALTIFTGQQKKWDQFSKYLQLLYSLAEFVQDLFTAKHVEPVALLQPEVKKQWQKLLDFCKTIKQWPQAESQQLNSAFLLLALFLGFHMLTDFKVAEELLQDVYVCYDKTKGSEMEDAAEGEDEPQWIEVLVDVLLKLMSMHSHLGRVIAACVFRLLSEHITPSAVALITEVLLPKKTAGGGTDDVLVETDNEDNLDDEDEDSNDMSDEGGNDENEAMDEGSATTKADSSVDSDAENEGSDENESLPDLSDSEMFKMDAMLAEVFKQKRQNSGKKVRVEKKQELINFQVRVLDLLETLIKGDRCGDFVFNLLKPLVTLMLKSGNPGTQVLADRAKALFTLLKSRAKGLKDSIHSTDDQKQLFLELLDLAKKATDKRHLQDVSTACYILTSISLSQSQKPASSCSQLVMDALERVISKKSSKPSVAFFSMLVELDPSQFQELGPKLVQKLKEESARPHGRMVCCMVLASLCKKTENVKKTDLKAMSQWMKEAVQVVTQLILSLDKVMFYKDVLTLTVALQARRDILSEVLFGADVKDHLMKAKSKFNTDIRRLANRIISSIDKENCQPKFAKKRKASNAGLTAAPSHKKLRV
ncbi:hypothetical protein BsWGS_03121 [Bradybaena similaris]